MYDIIFDILYYYMYDPGTPSSEYYLCVCVCMCACACVLYLDILIGNHIYFFFQDDDERAESALDGLKQVMTVKSRVVLPYLVPQVYNTLE